MGSPSHTENCDLCQHLGNGLSLWFEGLDQQRMQWTTDAPHKHIIFFFRGWTRVKPHEPLEWVQGGMRG